MEEETGHVTLDYRTARLVLDALSALEYHEEHGDDSLGGWDDGVLTALVVFIAGQMPVDERPEELRLEQYARYTAAEIEREK